MPPDELFGPVGYGWWWPFVGLAIMALVVWWVVRSWRGTPVKPGDTPPPPPPGGPVAYNPGDTFGAIRPIYLARVDEIEKRYEAGELDARAAHLALSAVVRDFATVRQGVDARVLTLTELKELSGTKRIARLIESYYQPAFSRRGSAGRLTRRAVLGARDVIRQW